MGDELKKQDKRVALREVVDALEYSLTIFDNAVCFEESDRDYPKMQALYHDIYTLYSVSREYMNEL